jgi:CIC family chloride channel protein
VSALDRLVLRWPRGRWARNLPLAAVTGAVTGLAVAGFEAVVNRAMLEHVLELPTPALAVLPAAGLVVAWLVLRTLGRGANPATSDEYIIAFHDPSKHFDPRRESAKVTAAAATLGSGGAMGFEGPSIYLGAVLGASIQRRFHRLFSDADRRVLMVAGAAAGVAAIFKAPATGAVFAIEVPYREDVAQRSVLPALVASATSYLVYVAIYGTTPILSGHGRADLEARTILASLLVGVCAGLGARAFAHLLRFAKQARDRLAPVPRLLLGGGGIALLVLVGSLEFDADLLVGPGYNTIDWATHADRAAGFVLVLFLLRAVATSLTVEGGGAGGLFIPLVVLGSLLGSFLGDVTGVENASLLTLVGAAAFLGAGYRTPIAAVIFITEATASPGFVVPGLLATVLAQLLIGSQSVSEYQRSVRGPAREALEPPETKGDGEI